MRVQTTEGYLADLQAAAAAGLEDRAKALRWSLDRCRGPRHALPPWQTIPGGPEGLYFIHAGDEPILRLWFRHTRPGAIELLALQIVAG